MDVITKLLMDPNTMDMAVDIIYNQQLDFDDIMQQLEQQQVSLDVQGHNHMTDVVVEYLTWAAAKAATPDQL